MKVFIQTFGCQMNKLDSVLVASSLEKNGFNLTEDVKEADIVLINTCSVRQHAEQRVLSHLGHLKHIKQSRPDMVVGVIGCMAQRLGIELLNHDEVDIVCGPAQIPQITELVKNVLLKKKKELAITEKIREMPQDGQKRLLNEFESNYDSIDKQIPGQAFVRIMHGCNKFCTYCIVPYVRGSEVCRPPEAIVEQVKRLAGEGVKQVMLLGQTVNSYKYSSGEKTYCLADLFSLVSKIEGIEWIKFVTSYPAEEFFDQILRAMADLPKVCNYLHIPAQSGSDRILKAMNRHYTSSQYLSLLDRARDIVPDIAIAGDFIVGFSGETEEEFQETIRLVQKARYKNAFVFKYSPRPGTTADKRFEDNIPYEIKKRRNIELLAVQAKNSDELGREFLGKTVKVLVEGPSKKPHLDGKTHKSGLQMIGRTAQDWIVVFGGAKQLAGKVVNIKITRSSPLTLFGEIT